MKSTEAEAQKDGIEADPYPIAHPHVVPASGYESFGGSLVLMPDAPPVQLRGSEFFMPYEPVTYAPPVFAEEPVTALEAVNAQQLADEQAEPVEMAAALETVAPTVQDVSPSVGAEAPVLEPVIEDGTRAEIAGGVPAIDADDDVIGNSLEPEPRQRSKKAPKEKAGPRFHNPKTLRFFDPVAAAAEGEDGADGSDVPIETTPRPSIELSAELKAAIILMDEQMRAKRAQQKAPPQKKKWWSPVSKRPPEKAESQRPAPVVAAGPASIAASPVVELVEPVAAIPGRAEEAQTASPVVEAQTADSVATAVVVPEMKPVPEVPAAEVEVTPTVAETPSEVAVAVSEVVLVPIAAVPTDATVLPETAAVEPAVEAASAVQPAPEPVAEDQAAVGVAETTAIVLASPTAVLQDAKSMIVDTAQPDAESTITDLDLVEPAPATTAIVVAGKAELAIPAVDDADEVDPVRPWLVPERSRGLVQTPTPKKDQVAAASSNALIEETVKKLATHSDKNLKIRSIPPSVLQSLREKKLAEQKAQNRLQEARETKKTAEDKEEFKIKLPLGTRFQLWLDADKPPVEKPLDGRRDGTRKRLPGLVAYYYSGGTPRPYEIANISKTGFYMRTQQLWSPDTMVRMTLQREDINKTISVLARVVRIDDGGVGHSFVTADVLAALRTRDILPSQGTNVEELEEFINAAPPKRKSRK